MLKLSLGGIAAGAGMVSRADGNFVGAALAQSPAPGFALGSPSPFEPEMVKDAARQFALQAYKPISTDLPQPLRNLSFEQYGDIHGKPSARLWANETLGFAIEPLHRGFLFLTPAEINIVSGGQARRIIYDQTQYDFGKLSVTEKFGDIGFSGFRILTAQDGKGFAETATFQGATFFRAVAQGQIPGIMARALSLKTADARGEEVPTIRSFWIEQPTLASNALVIHAVGDSESVAAAFRFTLHPGETTIIDIEGSLFPRVDLDNFGLATMSATVISNAIYRRWTDEVRSTIAEIGGLQMLTGKNEWIWRPVSDRSNLQISTFGDQNPHGFGFLQRNRAFSEYEDDDAHWEQRPSLWVEPIGDWGDGGVELIEVPSDSEQNDNIIAFWRPREKLTAGHDTSFAYRQFWCWNPPEQPTLAVVTDTRSGRGSGDHRRRFLVEFTGDILGDPLRNQGIKPVLSAAPGTITSVRQFFAPERKVHRVLFELDPGKESSSEMRLLLQAQDQTISETWLYRWAL